VVRGIVRAECCNGSLHPVSEMGPQADVTPLNTRGLLHSGRPPGAISMTTKGHVRVVGCRTVTPHTLKTRDSQTSPSSASVNEPENDQQDDGPDRRANDGGDNAVAEMDP
jgi:hypothetical protein